MRDLVLVALVVTVIILGGVVYDQGKAIEEFNTRIANSPSTAAEVFQMRSECATYAQQILKQHGSLEGQSVSSNYDQKKNRCYVELSVQLPSVDNYYLYDGQTGVTLAFATSENGKQLGSILSSHQANYDPDHYDDAMIFIGQMMDSGQ
jgi:hypothetical protein